MGGLEPPVHGVFGAIDGSTARSQGVLLGLAPEVARAQARLGMAVTRGLLIDLLATGDRAGVDAAMDLFLDTFLGTATPMVGQDP